MPDIPDPIGAIGGALSSAAESAASDALDAAGEKVWNVAESLLAGVFAVMDRDASPSVDPRTGPLAGVLPITLWVGAAVLLLAAFLQLGKSMAAGGRGFGTLVVGLAQYALVTTAGMGFLGVLIAASDGLATGLLAGGAHVDSFGALAGRTSLTAQAAQGAGGVAMGIVALICVIPAALGLLLESLIRHAAILVLGATMPILAAGLVFEATTRWFWTGLRWMVALLLLTPAIALVTVIGLQAAAGAVGGIGNARGAASSVVSLAVGGVTMLVALLCPLALFKLLAFLDPNTVAGGAVRGFFSGAGSPGDISGTSSAAPAGGADSDGGETATESRFGKGMAAASGAAGQVADSASERGGQILDTAGVGHYGVSTGSGQPRRGANAHAGHGDATADDDDSGATDTSPDPGEPQPPNGPTPGGDGVKPNSPAGDPDGTGPRPDPDPASPLAGSVPKTGGGGTAGGSPTAGAAAGSGAAAGEEVGVVAL
jgi:hypothetical protein